MASVDQNRPILDLMKEDNYLVRTLSIGKQENEHNVMFFPKERDVQEHNNNYGVSSGKQENERNVMFFPKERDVQEHNNNYAVVANAHENKQMKLQESGSSTLEKLQAFFEIVQKQHPESRLELQCVEGGWKVWCGACKKLLRPDKSGKAIHNIQRQHFASSRHKKKLHLMLQTEEEVEREKKEATKGGGGETHCSKHTDQAS